MNNQDRAVVLITGASGGIGAATAERLARAGSRVVLCDLAQGPLDEIAKTLADDGHDTLPIAADTVDEDAMNRAVAAAVEQYGRLDGLVTAAGIRQTAKGFLDLDLATWDRIQAVNVTGTFIACRAAARAMLADGRGGSIVTIASVTSVAARMNQSAYCASKASVLHLTKTIALELAWLAQPEEQAAAVEWLLSPAASYVTGAALMVDGGVSLV